MNNLLKLLLYYLYVPNKRVLINVFAMPLMIISSLKFDCIQ